MKRLAREHFTLLFLGMACLGTGTMGCGPSNDFMVSGSAGDEDSDGLPRYEDKFVGNITTRNNVRDDFIQYWDQITPENESKWSSIERERDVMDWSGLDRAYNYSREHGIPFKGHTFVWGSQYPRWIVDLPPNEQREEVEEWIRLFCERYPDTEMIDVVNEPPPHTTPPFMDALGGAGDTGYDWIIWSFERARHYCPNSILILNDYNVLIWDTGNFLSIVRAIQHTGYIDALGAQAHRLEGLTADELGSTLRLIQGTGLPVYISEYDVDLASDEEQLFKMREQFPIFYESSGVAGITLWGYIHGQTWVPNSGLIRNGQPRPALTWLMDYLDR